MTQKIWTRGQDMRCNKGLSLLCDGILEVAVYKGGKFIQSTRWHTNDHDYQVNLICISSELIFILDSWAIRDSLNECYKTRTILREILSIIWVLYYGWHFKMESSHRWNSSLLSSDLYYRCTGTCFTSTSSTKIILSFTFDELQGCMFSNRAMALINF